MDILQVLHKQLIVSCQALKDEPLYDSYIMSKMALAATYGGAKGIRANTVQDIQAIKKETVLPIIGIIKRNYSTCAVFITPTMQEIDELYEEGVEIIALDATNRPRPFEDSFIPFFKKVRAKYPTQLFMADTSTVEEAIMAEKAGVDIVATTLVGYTPYTKNHDPLQVLQKVVQAVRIPVIAEGNIDTPEKAQEAIKIGAHAVVVGGAITRPQQITEKFVQQLFKKFEDEVTI
ncbi:N-acetylmannosamine-6-phosphate 2-epimerase [Kurthia sibirica]|uniref:N-acetylmannosamine-6-phosphate 2-epimerase n=1 Tax=Kurthia sibirica TaxID=202750 RepID=UPI00117422FE|nr:N-acetylmannosamine-6-phosphate 2-epimerase [Kurthia sibirica]GEK34456.1 putative N-acetylmannosamine-6-phosphate 2-epimerase [Kurthia sibirica]